MKGGMLRYKCRMCDEQYENIHVPNLMVTLTRAVATSNTDLFDLHYHLDRNTTGVADLIGGVEDDNDKETR